MKKIIAMTALIFSSILTYACTDGAKQKQSGNARNYSRRQRNRNEQRYVYQGRIRLREIQRVEI